MFYFQAKDEYAGKFLSKAATLVEKDIPGKMLIIDFSYTVESERTLRELLSQHMFMGTQNMIYEDDDGKHTMVVIPQWNMPITRDKFQVKYYVSACTIE